MIHDNLKFVLVVICVTLSRICLL